MYTVIVVDDSSFMRSFLTDMIEKIEGFNVVAKARDAFEARDLIKLHEPDLVTLDVNMPKMDGVAFLKNLMRLHPMPVIVISTDVSRSKDVFDDGAVGFIPKPEPKESHGEFYLRLKDTFLRYEFLLKRYKQRKKPPVQKPEAARRHSRNHPDAVLPSSPAVGGAQKLIAIGSSTGGIETLMKIFSQIGRVKTPIVIAQHIPYGFSNSFAQRLNGVASMRVKQAEDGEQLQPATAYLAPGDKHMIIHKREGKLFVCISSEVKVSMHRPSVDILFRSVNNSVGAKAMGIILTGMGDDGIIGLKELRDNGAVTLGQEKSSCVVYGMPKRALETGAVSRMCTIKEIAEAIREQG